MYVHMSRDQKSILGIIPQGSSHWFLRPSLSLRPRTHQSGSAHWPVSSKLSPVSVSPVPRSQVCYQGQLSYVGAEDSNLGPDDPGAIIQPLFADPWFR